MECPTNAQIENESKKLKRDLEPWRELIIPIYSVLMWEQLAFAAIIPAVTSIFFLIFWFLDPTLLTSIALFGLLFSIADYGVPLICAYLFPPDNWNGGKERKLDNFCKSVTEGRLFATYGLKFFWNMRKNRPKVFYLITIPMFIILIWIGNGINNILLSYIFVTAFLLFPGLKHQGYLNPILAPIGKLLCSKTTQQIEKKKE